MLKMVQAACKQYERARDFYAPKVCAVNRHDPTDTLRVPRIAPPRNRVEPVVKEIVSTLGFSMAENGKVTRKEILRVYSEMLTHDAGTNGMPSIAEFVASGRAVSLCHQYDATGFGDLSLTTTALKNPFASHSAERLYIYSLANAGDSRAPMMTSLGDNRDAINAIARSGVLHLVQDGGLVSVLDPRVADPLRMTRHIVLRAQTTVTVDLSCLRHTERMSCSGACSCSREFALRTVPSKPSTVEEMFTTCLVCHAPTREERWVWSHTPLPGEPAPRPCTRAGCRYAHETPAADYAAMLATIDAFKADTSAGAERRYCDWRMAHAQGRGTVVGHGNVQPGPDGAPMMDLSSMLYFLIDLLHGLYLNLPYNQFKAAFLQHCPDPCRALLSTYLKEEVNHPLDLRKKGDGRIKEQRWYKGESFASMVRGDRGSPGGPVVYAAMAMIIGLYLLEHPPAPAAVPSPSPAPTPVPSPAPKPAAGRGRGRGSAATHPPAPPPGRGRGRGTWRGLAPVGNYAESSDDEPPPLPPQPKPTPPPVIPHTPTAVEAAADQVALAKIRAVFGGHGQLIINMLLSSDAYLSLFWTLHHVHHPDINLSSPQEDVDVFALAVCRDAIDFNEMLIRIATGNLKAYYSHLFSLRVPRQISLVKDLWAFYLGPLELNNAATKRRAERNASKHLTTSSSGTNTAPVGRVALAKAKAKGEEAPVGKVVVTKGYSTSMTYQTATHRGAALDLKRSGLGIDTREALRLFGDGQPGRIKRVRAGPKIAKMGKIWLDPVHDTALAAFIRDLESRGLLSPILPPGDV